MKVRIALLLFSILVVACGRNRGSSARTDGGGGGDASGFDLGGLPSIENDNATCTDGADNDGDGYMDCSDDECRFNTRISACGAPATSAEATDLVCFDTVDNDGDGRTDCTDVSCQYSSLVTVCEPPEETDTACSDGRDNDLNGHSDCDDFACSRSSHVTVCGSPTLYEDTEARCSDAMDNDSDTFVDCNDFNCVRWTEACHGTNFRECYVLNRGICEELHCPEVKTTLDACRDVHTSLCGAEIAAYNTCMANCVQIVLCQSLFPTF